MLDAPLFAVGLLALPKRFSPTLALHFQYSLHFLQILDVAISTLEVMPIIRNSKIGLKPQYRAIDFIVRRRYNITKMFIEQIEEG